MCKVDILGLVLKCPYNDKIIYDNKKDAELAAYSTRLRTNIPTYTAYKCKYCGKYHVGHFHENIQQKVMKKFNFNFTVDIPEDWDFNIDDKDINDPYVYESFLKILLDIEDNKKNAKVDKIEIKEIV